jgi:hypothetical protein
MSAAPAPAVPLSALLGLAPAALRDWADVQEHVSEACRALLAAQEALDARLRQRDELLTALGLAPTPLALPEPQEDRPARLSLSLRPMPQDRSREREMPLGAPFLTVPTTPTREATPAASALPSPSAQGALRSRALGEGDDDAGDQLHEERKPVSQVGTPGQSPETPAPVAPEEAPRRLSVEEQNQLAAERGLLSAHQAAERLGVTDAALRIAIRKGTLRPAVEGIVRWRAQVGGEDQREAVGGNS